MALFALIAGVLLYVLLTRFVLRRLGGWWRDAAFAAVNVAALYLFLFHGQNKHYQARFAAYLALIAFQYAMLRLFADKKGWQPWLAFFTPIAALVLIRYIPASLYRQISAWLGTSWSGRYPNFVGLSYLAFRTSHLVLEVRNRTVAMPGFARYLGYCFFVPTMAVGPINPYSNFQRGFASPPPEIPVGRALLRILVGLVKYQFLGSFFNQLGYSGLLLDGHPHPWIDLPVAMVFYYLFLYCNFSGFCDVAIGMAGLIGVPVAENFRDPLLSRNMREFWNRWHITLSEYMRDVVFAPLSKAFARLFGPAQVNQAVAVTIVIVFLLVGIWHGVGWNYVAFGAAQALGVVTVHYYTIGLKRWLGRDGFKAYNANPLIHAVAVALTFCYFAASLFLFGNTLSEMKEIIGVLR